MPFIGKNPTAGFATIVKDDFTADGSTTVFTLSKIAATANDIAVFVGNVRQEPTDAYTVNGTTLTMSAAPATGVNFYVLHIAGTIESSVVPPDGSIGTAKLVNDAVTTAKIADDAVTTAKIAAGQVTSAKLDTNIAVTGDLTVDTNTLKVDSSSNTVGIRNTSSSSIQASNGRPGLVVGDTSGARGIAILSSATGAGSLLFANATSGAGAYHGYIEYDHNGNRIDTYINSTVHAQRIHSNGVISVPQGIALGAGAANTAANVIDDYEEGTFNLDTSTGVVFSGGGSASITGQTNNYRKVGSLVVCQLRLVLNFSAGCSGNMEIQGLPFTSTPDIYEAVMQYNNQSHGWVYDGNLFKGSSNTNILWYGRSLNPSSISNFYMWFQTTYFAV